MAERVLGIFVLLVAGVTVGAACTDAFEGCSSESYEANLGTLYESLCAPPPPQYNGGVASLPHFTAEPVDKVETGLSLQRSHTMLLECNYTTLDNAYNGTITWEHNGLAVVSGSEGLRVTMSPSSQSSQLYVKLPLTDQTTGRYLCKVSNGNYTVASRTATVTRAYTNGWLDQVYTTQQPVLEDNGSSVLLHAQAGGSIILECQPNTTDEATSSRHWLHREDGTFEKISSSLLHTILPDGNLLVRNFSLPTSGSTDEYKCSVPFVDREERRSFTISEGPVVPLLPSSRSVAVGDSLTLYCLPLNLASSFEDIVWLKDDHPLLLPGSTTEGADWSHFQPMGEVLVLENVTMEMAGVYTCLSKPEDKAYSAILTVIGPPDAAGITILGQESSAANDKLFIPVEPGSSNTSTSALHCTCNSSNDEALEYKWMFRGSDVDSFGDMFEVVDNALNIVAPDLWDAIGSYQCTVSNIAGSVTTSIQLLPRDVVVKPAPPLNVHLTQGQDRATYPYKYLLQWGSSQPTGEVVAYKVVIDVIRPTVSLKRYTCHQDLTFTDGPQWIFWGNDFISDEYRFIFRIAASSADGVWSELTPFNGCPQPFTMKKEPPTPPSALSHEAVPDAKAHLISTTLHWTFDECSFPSENLLEVSLELNCSGLKPLRFDNPAKASAREYSVGSVIPCCTYCSWALILTYTFNSTLASRKEDNFTTPTLSPSLPAVLNSVERPSQSNGEVVTVNFTLPPANASCKPTEVLVRYGNQTVSKGLRYDLPSDQPLSMTVDLQDSLCWEKYSISVAYRNTEGQSDFSSVMPLEGPSADSVNGFIDFEVVSTNSKELEARWNPDSGVECLLSRSLAEAKVCFAPFNSSQQSCPSIISENCQTIISPSATFLTINSGIRPYTEYCFSALLVMNNDSTTNITGRILAAKTYRYFPPSKKEAVSTSYSVPLVAGVVCGALLLAAVIIAILVVVCMCQCRKKRKRRQHNDRMQRLHSYSDEEINSQQSFDFQSEYSNRTDHTEISPLMPGYLKDVEEDYLRTRKNPEGSADELDFEEREVPTAHSCEEEMEQLLDSANPNLSGVDRLNSSPGSAARSKCAVREPSPHKLQEKLKLELVHGGYVVQGEERLQSQLHFEKSSTNGEELSKSLESTQLAPAQLLPHRVQPPERAYLASGLEGAAHATQLTSSAGDSSSHSSFDLFEDNFVPRFDFSSPSEIKQALTTVSTPSNGYCTEQQARTSLSSKPDLATLFPVHFPPPPPGTPVATVNMSKHPLSGYCTQHELPSLLARSALPSVRSETRQIKPQPNGYVTSTDTCADFNTKLPSTVPTDSQAEFDLSDLSDSETSSVFADPVPHESACNHLQNSTTSDDPLHLTAAANPLQAIPNALKRTRSVMTSGIYSASSESPEANNSPAESRSNSAMSYDLCSTGSSSSSGLGHHQQVSQVPGQLQSHSCFNGSEGYHSVGGSAISSQDNSQSICSGYVSSPEPDDERSNSEPVDLLPPVEQLPELNTRYTCIPSLLPSYSNRPAAAALPVDSPRLQKISFEFPKSAEVSEEDQLIAVV